jgi:hypothetical protein
MIVNHKIGSVSGLGHVPLGQGHHQSDSVSQVHPVLAGQQLVVVVGVDLADPYTNYMVAVAEIDILEGVHCSQVRMALVDHYCMGSERLPGRAPDLR